jgi:hypothetical protein
MILRGYFLLYILRRLSASYSMISLGLYCGQLVNVDLIAK